MTMMTPYGVIGGKELSINYVLLYGAFSTIGVLFTSISRYVPTTAPPILQLCFTADLNAHAQPRVPPHLDVCINY